MSSASSRFVFTLYNYSGLFCLRFRDGVFQISYFIMTLNILHLLLSCSLMFLVNSNLLQNFVFLRQDLADLRNFSLFSKFVILLGTTVLQICADCVFIAQISNRNKVEDFVNEALRMRLNEKYFEKFGKTCIESTSLLGIYFIIMVIFKYYTIMEPSLLNVFVYVLLCYPFVVIFSLVSFVKMFEIFVVAYLQEIESDLIALPTCKLYHNNLTSEREDFLSIHRKYQNLFEFVQKFKTSFGTHLTLSVSFITAGVVFSVNNILHLNSYLLNLKSFSGLQFNPNFPKY